MADETKCSLSSENKKQPPRTFASLYARVIKAKKVVSDQIKSKSESKETSTRPIEYHSYTPQSSIKKPEKPEALEEDKTPLFRSLNEDFVNVGVPDQLQYGCMILNGLPYLVVRRVPTEEHHDTSLGLPTIERRDVSPFAIGIHGSWFRQGSDFRYLIRLQSYKEFEFSLMRLVIAKSFSQAAPIYKVPLSRPPTTNISLARCMTVLFRQCGLQLEGPFKSNPISIKIAPSQMRSFSFTGSHGEWYMVKCLESGASSSKSSGRKENAALQDHRDLPAKRICQSWTYHSRPDLSLVQAIMAHNNAQQSKEFVPNTDRFSRGLQASQALSKPSSHSEESETSSAASFDADTWLTEVGDEDMERTYASNILESLVKEFVENTIEELVYHGISHAESSGSASSRNVESSASSDSATLPTENSRSRKRLRDYPTQSRQREDQGKESNDDSEDENHPRKQRKGKENSCSMFQKRLRCPFFSNDPEKYGSNQACSGGRGFPDMAKLIQHLKRTHWQPRRCPRCWQELKSQKLLEQHLQKDTMCEKLPEPEDDRISQARWEEISSTKPSDYRIKTVEEKWTLLYRALFPTEERVPSPYDKPVMIHQLEPLLIEVMREELSKRLGPDLAIAQEEIRDMIPSIVQTCKDRLSNSLRYDLREEAVQDPLTTPITLDLAFNENASRPDLPIRAEPPVVISQRVVAQEKLASPSVNADCNAISVQPDRQPESPQTPLSPTRPGAEFMPSQDTSDAIHAHSESRLDEFVSQPTVGKIAQVSNPFPAPSAVVSSDTSNLNDPIMFDDDLNIELSLDPGMKIDIDFSTLFPNEQGAMPPLDEHMWDDLN